MCSPYHGESPSPYSDTSSSGAPSPPTVVTAYNRQYDSKFFFILSYDLKMLDDYMVIKVANESYNFCSRIE